jgi:ABC-type multidrug transport system permease subunit
LPERQLDFNADLRRKANADVIVRPAIGAAVYPILLFLIGVTTPYKSEHSTLFWSAALAFAIAIGARFVSARCGKGLIRPGGIG